MQSNIKFLLLLLLCISFAPIGCSSGIIAPPVEGIMHPATTPLKRTDIYPLIEGSWQYVDVLKQEEKEQVPITRVRTKTDEYSAAWRDSEDERKIEYWNLNETKNVILSAVIEHDDNSLVFFNPPLVICPVELEPDVEYKSQSSMKVVSATNPKQQRARGKAEMSIKYVGDQEITTPLGDFLAHRIEINFYSDMTVAKAENTTIQWIVPELGIVIEDRIKKVTILGIFGKPKHKRLVLTVPLQNQPQEETTSAD